MSHGNALRRGSFGNAITQEPRRNVESIRFANIHREAEGPAGVDRDSRNRDDRDGRPPSISDNVTVNLTDEFFEEAARRPDDPVTPIPTAQIPGLFTQRSRSQNFSESPPHDAVDYEKAAEDVKRGIAMDAPLTKLEDAPLTPEDAFRVSELRAENDLLLAKAEVDLLNAQQKAETEDVLFNQSLKDAGLADDIDLLPLEEAIAQTGGLGAQTYQAIQAIINNVDISEGEKSEAIDLVMLRFSFSEAIEEAIIDMTTQVSRLEELEARDDVFLLGKNADFINPTVPFDVQGATPAARYENNFLDDLQANTPGIADAMADAREGDFALQNYDELELLASTGGIGTTRYDMLLEQVAADWGPEYGVVASSLDAAFQQADRKATKSEEDWDKAFEGDSFIPGSEGAIAAIYMTLIEAGYDPQYAENFAKSADVHMMADVMSGGRSGIANPGTTAGIFGMTKDAMARAMGEEWTPKSGLQWEILAMAQWVQEAHGGDPLAAVEFFRNHAEWGGSSGE